LSQAAKVGETGDGFTPMPIEEARAVAEAVTGLDRDTLLAERAEAEAQLRAAEATLAAAGEATPATAEATPAAVVANGERASEQEPDEPTQKTQDVDAPNGALILHVEELREAAAAARAADDELAEAASEAERPPGRGPHLESAESALAQALEIQEDLPAAWRRLVGALISATGMAIVIGALGWNIYWLLVPIALIAILTVDLRLSGKAAREISAEAARELAAAGKEGRPESGDGPEEQDGRSEAAEARLAAARANREAAYARFEELAPGRSPSEVEEIIAEHEAALAAAAAAESEAAARRAAADAGRALAESLRGEEEEPQQEATAEPAAAAVEAEPAVEVPEVEPEPAAAAVPDEVETPAAVETDTTEPETAEPRTAEPRTAEPKTAEPKTAEPKTAEPKTAEPKTAEPKTAEPKTAEPETAAADVATPEPPVEVPATASEWWFGSAEAPAPPPAASAPVRALAERLSAEGREALARIEAQLAALERAELAKKSLEWHETNGSAKPETSAPTEADRT
jgi:hypothetical protein